MISKPEHCAPSTTRTPKAIPNWEVLGRRKAPHRELRDDCAALRHFLEDLLVLLGKIHIDPATENSDAGASIRA